MATEATKGSAFSISAGLVGTDYLLAIATVGGVTNNYLVSVTTLFTNVASISTANLVIKPSSSIPTTSNSNGVQGQVVYDNTHIYVCVSNNTWARATLSNF